MRHIEECGDDALSVNFDDRGKRQLAAEQIRESNSWLECVEGMQSIVVQFDTSTTSVDAARELLRSQLDSLADRTQAEMPSIEIPVCYGGEFGPEFESIAEMLGLDVDELIGIHTSREHRVEMLGFTPGFAYVADGSDELNVPRLSEPRQNVAAGSVGLAGGHTGLYALAGPGGWPLVGRTPIALFQADEAQPFLLRAGSRVRFTAIDEKTYRRMATK